MMRASFCIWLLYFQIVFCTIKLCESKIVKAIIEGPGLQRLGDYPGILEFYRNHLLFYDNIEYRAFPQPSDRADLVLKDEKGETQKRMIIAALPADTICNIVEDAGIARREEKRLDISEQIHQQTLKFNEQFKKARAELEEKMNKDEVEEKAKKIHEKEL